MVNPASVSSSVSSAAFNSRVWNGLIGMSRPGEKVIRFGVETISRPDDEKNASWTGETGRVNMLTEKDIDRYGLSPDDTIVYACGHPQMIEDVKRRLDGTGFRVEEERFWKED